MSDKSSDQIALTCSQQSKSSRIKAPAFVGAQQYARGEGRPEFRKTYQLFQGHKAAIWGTWFRDLTLNAAPTSTLTPTPFMEERR